MNNMLKERLKESQAYDPTEQEGVAPKNTDICTCETESTQDRDKSPKLPMKRQTRKHVSIDRIMLLDGGLPIIVLRIESLFSGEIRYEKISYENFSPETLKKCVTRNGGMTYDWRMLFDRLIHEITACRSNQLTIIHGHTKLGWIKRTEDPVFYHQDVTSSDNQISEYMGEMDIQPKGSLENIVGMINEWILSTPEWSPLEAIISFSVASVILPFAKDTWGKTMNNLLLHLYGISSSGKSTSLRLHAGLASNPFNEKNGFWLNHQSSLVAIINRIGDNQGLPVSIDELSSASRREYDEFVYSLGNGVEKDRLKAGGLGRRDAVNFSTIVLSSGEVSILDMCSEKEGIRARCVEFRNVKWTNSKEQSDAIYNCLRGNCGWVAPLVAQELLNNSNKWKIKWDQIYSKVNRQMDEENIRLDIGARISEFVVLFAIAAEIANVVLSINLNVEEIYNFSFQHVIASNANQTNLGERAYRYLLQYAIEHPESFPECEKKGTSYYSEAKIKGFYKQGYTPKNGKKSRRQLVFLKDSYEEILEEGEFLLTEVNRKLRSAGFLLTHDPKRYTYRLTYNDVRQNCYVLYCDQ